LSSEYPRFKLKRCPINAECQAGRKCETNFLKVIWFNSTKSGFWTMK